MARKSITRRWITNNLGVIVLILLVIELALIYAVQSYFYNNARQYLTTKLNAVSGLLTRYAADGTNISLELRSTLESFSDKDKMELMAVDYNGTIVLTSSGFSSDHAVSMPDYDKAMNTGGLGSGTGKTEHGERIMMVCCPITEISSEFSAIRVVTSLEAIDRNVRSFVLVLTLVAVAILLFLGLSDFYFVSTILRPIREINSNTEKFAQGDFSARIMQESEDEIGELCRGINHMADELSATEAMKNEFISSVSHELRTPLTAIKGWAETLTDMTDFSDEPPDAEMMQKGLHVIVGETERLSQMVEELLDFSRMQSGHFTLQMGTMDVLAELGDAVLIYVERAKKDEIYVTYEEPEMLPFVFGDKNRIRQVFINIIDNAIKYSDKGGHVYITAEASESGDAVRIIVQDDGCGIKASDLAKVKTKFYKPNHTRRGSGIGLAVADEIVSLHKGTLTIESEEGVGTRVTITLPAQKPKAEK